MCMRVGKECEVGVRENEGEQLKKLLEKVQEGKVLILIKFNKKILKIKIQVDEEEQSIRIDKIDETDEIERRRYKRYSWILSSRL